MTAEVASVGPDTPRSEIARLLVAKGISAVPVVDRGGVPIGIVSEGDLLGRNDAERATRRDWWLDLLAQGETLNEDFLNSLRAPERNARELMSAPVVTVDAETNVGEAARLLTAYRIKRVPVIEDGHMVGIVSRADLLRALAATAPASANRRAGVRRMVFSTGSIGNFTTIMPRSKSRRRRPPLPAKSASMPAIFAASSRILRSTRRRVRTRRGRPPSSATGRRPES